MRTENTYGPRNEPVIPQTLTERLELVRNRPAMYLGKVTPENLTLFLFGFHLAKGHYEPDDGEMARIREEITEARGWQRNSISYNPMRSRGMSDEDIVSELLTIEIESLKVIEAEQNPR